MGRTEAVAVFYTRNIPELGATVFPAPLPVPAGTRTPCGSPSAPALPATAAGGQGLPEGLGLHTCAWAAEGGESRLPVQV